MVVDLDEQQQQGTAAEDAAAETAEKEGASGEAVVSDDSTAASGDKLKLQVDTTEGGTAASSHKQRPVPGPSEVDHFVPVWFATNRKMNEKGVYGKEQDAEKNSYGRLDFTLEVAQDHDSPKHKKEMPAFASKNEEDFLNEIEERMEKFVAIECEPQILVCFHNYKEGFEQSLCDAAHWQEDLNVTGAVISYSWPSVGGGSGHYNPDYAGIERSEHEIKMFLLKLAERFDATKVHILADGVSCLGLLRAFQRMATDQVELKLGQVFLLVPDIDKTLFCDLAWLFPKYTTRTTMYTSGVDADMKRSVKRHAAPRAGFFEPHTVVDGVDTIAMKELETNCLDRETKTYSYEIAALFHDMYDLMKNNTHPNRRLHMNKESKGDTTFWHLRRLHGTRHAIPLPF